jgi:Rha family phage regulatory protein
MSEDTSKHTTYSTGGATGNLPSIPATAVALSIGPSGDPTVDSRDIAARFGKRHADVIRAIRDVIRSLQEDARQPIEIIERNFASFKIKDLTGETTSHYLMNRDGFVHLAMGFTGKEAVRWKVAYIAAFNAMEAELRGPSPKRITNRRSKEAITKERAEIARIQADAARFVQEAAMGTAESYAGFLQRTLNLDANAAFLGGCNAAKAAHGVDIRQSTAITHIDSESQQTWHTPTELGKIENGLSAMKINQMLEQAGLQTKPDGKQWTPTDSGKKYSRILDTGKKHNSGVPVIQAKWSKDVLQKMGSVA